MRKSITTSLLATGLVLAVVPAFAQGGSPAPAQHQTQAQPARPAAPATQAARPATPANPSGSVTAGATGGSATGAAAQRP
ncbi:MAG TPA: hypothetical protein VN329_07875, partial [Roseomonas sp.]|nr:hypothetical protein [Roseomonas sp.]